MSTGRRRARREALFELYRADLLGRTASAGSAAGEGRLPAEMDAYQRRLLDGVTDHTQELDLELGRRLEGWTLSRLAPLERNILRLGLFELRHCTDTPVAVVVAEAVELAKRYCSDEAARLINGVLGGLVADAEARESSS